MRAPLPPLYFKIKPIASYKKHRHTNFFFFLHKTGKSAFFSFFNGAAPPHKIIQMGSNCTGMFIRTWNNFWQLLYVKVPKLFFSLHPEEHVLFSLNTKNDTFWTNFSVRAYSPRFVNFNVIWAPRTGRVRAASITYIAHSMTHTL